MEILTYTCLFHTSCLNWDATNMLKLRFDLPFWWTAAATQWTTFHPSLLNAIYRLLSGKQILSVNSFLLGTMSTCRWGNVVSFYNSHRKFVRWNWRVSSREKYTYVYANYFFLLKCFKVKNCQTLKQFFFKVFSEKIRRWNHT